MNPYTKTRQASLSQVRSSWRALGAFMAYGKNQSRFLFTSIGIAVALLFACAPGYAQSFTGSIAGTVTDPSGAVVPGAQVTITQTETNRRVTTLTRADGVYLATALAVGDYRVEAAAAGFKLGVRTGIN